MQEVRLSTAASLVYPDVSSISSYAQQTMTWAVQQGLITGTSGTVLSPQRPVTRAQVATLLMQYI